MEGTNDLISSESDHKRVGVPVKEGGALMVQTVDSSVVRVPVYLKAYHTSCRHYVVLSQATGSKLQRDVCCINLRTYRCCVPDPDTPYPDDRAPFVLRLVPQTYEGHSLTLELSCEDERTSWLQVLQSCDVRGGENSASSPLGPRRRHPLLSCHSEGYLRNVPSLDVTSTYPRSSPASPQKSPPASPLASNLRRLKLQRSCSGPGGFQPWGSQGSLRSHSLGSDSEGDLPEPTVCEDAGRRSPSAQLDGTFNFSPRLSPSPMLRRPTLPSVSEDANTNVNCGSYDEVFH